MKPRDRDIHRRCFHNLLHNRMICNTLNRIRHIYIYIHNYPHEVGMENSTKLYLHEVGTEHELHDITNGPDFTLPPSSGDKSHRH